MYIYFIFIKVLMKYVERISNYVYNILFLKNHICEVCSDIQIADREWLVLVIPRW